MKQTMRILAYCAISQIIVNGGLLVFEYYPEWLVSYISVFLGLLLQWIAYLTEQDDSDKPQG